jgi:cytochrome c553
MKTSTLLVALACLPVPALAGQPVLEMLAGYSRQAGAGFDGFSAERGRQFFTARHATDNAVSACASCHGSDPTVNGKHHRTGKRIKPMAPAVNPERLTNAYKVEKWFGRNCRDVLERECTAIEKGDVLTWLMAVK